MKHLCFKAILAAGTISIMSNTATAVDRYVDHAAPGGIGTSWATAYNSLSTALSFSSAGDNIFVAEGTYSPGAQETSTFTIPAGVSIYGGFENGDNFGEQSPAAHPTILDGDDTARHVVTISSSSVFEQTKLSGFTITGGNATTGASSQRRGGGVYIANNAQAVEITNCVFSDNAAEYGGGLLADFDFASKASVYVSNCTFDNNSATASGGALAARGADIMVINCLFYENTAATGAGVFSQNGGQINLVNSTITDNSATSAGGGGVLWS